MRRLRRIVLLCTLTFFCSAALFPSVIAWAQATAAGPCSPEIEQRIASAVTAQDYKEALAAVDLLERNATASFGENSRCYAAALSERAAIFQLLDRSSDAKPLFEKAIQLLRLTSGPQDPKLSLALNNYGVNLFWLRRYKEAARAHEEALDARRKLDPPDPAAVADSLHNLADAYRYTDPRNKDIKRLYEEALDIKSGLAHPDNVSIAQTRQNLASMQENLGLLGDAAYNLEQVLKAYRLELKPDDPRIASVLNRQGILLFRRGDYKSAEGKFEEALRLERGSTKTQQVTLAATLDDFALTEIQLGRYSQGQLLAREAFEIRRRIFPDNHPTIARTLSNLSYIAWLTRRNDDALALAREASQITVASGPIDAAGKVRLQRHLLVLWSKIADGGSEKSSRALAEEAFAIGQQAIRSETAATLARTALRFSARDQHLRDMLKEIADLDQSSTALEQTISHALTLPSAEATEKFGKIRSEISSLTERRKAVLAQIEKSYPDYARLVEPKPITAASVQSLLNPSEALIAFVVGIQDVFAWCVTQETLSFRKLDVSPQQLKNAIDTMRRSLDDDPETNPKASLFDLGLANTVYSQLVGPISPQLRSKSRLIVVPSGPLIGLPLQLLVSSRPKAPPPMRTGPQVFKTADWLIRRFAISEIPSVESLDLLRRRALPSANRKPLIGFANPLPSPDFVPPAPAKTASANPFTARGPKISRGLPASVGEAHDIRALREFLAHNPLDQTGPELKSVAEVVGADDDDLFIGSRATETAVKNAKLASYRIVYFATHGLVAGAFRESEPSLVLTVPAQPSDNDDGLLTASEITQLSLDADWVVLSACNTASSGGGDAEGLSGLARAFFHAGARALLVSNWSLDDISAAEITKAAFRAMQNRSASSRSQALQQAMLAQINGAGAGEKLWDAYPGRWAAFEIVGVD